MKHHLVRAAIRGLLTVAIAGTILYIWQLAAQVMWSINYRACTNVICLVEPRDPLDTITFLKEMPYELFTYYWQGIVLVAMLMAAAYLVTKGWYWAKALCDRLEGKLVARKLMAVAAKEASRKS